MKTRLAGLRRAIDPRLYPVIVLLLAALVLVPGQLRDRGGDPAPADAATTLPAAPGVRSLPATVVTLKPPTAKGGRRLGSRKNPFKAEPKSDEPDAGAATAVATPSGGDPPAAAPTTGRTPKDPGDPATDPTPTATPAPTQTPAPSPATTETAWTASARFGPVGGRPQAEPLTRLAGLPDPRGPVLLYAGLRRDHETAVFLVAAGTGVSGEGRCWPARDNCKQLSLRAGETARLVTPRRTFDVQLRPVRKRRVSHAAAQESRAAVAAGGRMALRTMLDRVGPLRYDPSTGVLNTVDGRTRATP